MTPEEVTACQVKLDRILSEFDEPGLVGKVREYPGWVDEETGEENEPVWVAEVRYRDGDVMRTLTLDTEYWCDEAMDEVWIHEIGELVR